MCAHNLLHFAHLDMSSSRGEEADASRNVQS